MKHVIVCGLFILLVMFNTAYAGVTSDDNILNSTAPEFSLTDLNNRLRNSAEWKGKTIILNFWATWCTPCRKEIPLLNKMQKEYSDDGLVVIGVAIDNIIAVQQFTQKIPINYIKLIGGTDATRLIQQYGNHTGVLPYTVIIDKRGKIVSIAQGLLTESYLRQSLEKWL